MNQRIYIIGTDTEIGKTAFFEEVLLQAKAQGQSVTPFKPAQSGKQSYEDSDCGRIMKAAELDRELSELVTPNRFNEDRAPGAISSLGNFTSETHAQDPEPLHRSLIALEKLEQKIGTKWTIIEGAGGLWVPMPGGAWQPTWIKRLSQSCIVVAPVSLGTINHTILTVDAIRAMGHPILGIAWTGAKPAPASLAIENMAIVEAQTNLQALARPNEKGQVKLVPKFFETLQELAPTCQYRSSRKSH